MNRKMIAADQWGGAPGTAARCVHGDRSIAHPGAFVVFMTTVYFAIVVPYRQIQKRRGVTVFGEPPATKACTECCSDIPEAAHKCKFCTSEQSAPPA